ncbi:MAG: hypothetical protein KJO77_05475 [Bacteroidia bacterium]|nr:hypothetical protein [Bacteroidia bacterium]NND52569.1 hypothetical protein [Flavobacteriaceae bacterium]
MKNKRYLSYIALLIGSAIVIYAQSETVENSYLLVLGIILLMGGLFGIYLGITKAVPPKEWIQSEDEEE